MVADSVAVQCYDRNTTGLAQMVVPCTRSPALEGGGRGLRPACPAEQASGQHHHHAMQSRPTHAEFSPPPPMHINTNTHPPTYSDRAQTHTTPQTHHRIAFSWCWCSAMAGSAGDAGCGAGVLCQLEHPIDELLIVSAVLPASPISCWKHTHRNNQCVHTLRRPNTRSPGRAS